MSAFQGFLNKYQGIPLMQIMMNAERTKHMQWQREFQEQQAQAEADKEAKNQKAKADQARLDKQVQRNLSLADLYSRQVFSSQEEVDMATSKGIIPQVKAPGAGKYIADIVMKQQEYDQLHRSGFPASGLGQRPEIDQSKLRANMTPEQASEYAASKAEAHRSRSIDLGGKAEPVVSGRTRQEDEAQERADAEASRLKNAKKIRGEEYRSLLAGKYKSKDILPRITDMISKDVDRGFLDPEYARKMLASAVSEETTRGAARDIGAHLGGGIQQDKSALVNQKIVVGADAPSGKVVSGLNDMLVKAQQKVNELENIQRYGTGRGDGTYDFSEMSGIIPKIKNLLKKGKAHIGTLKGKELEEYQKYTGFRAAVKMFRAEELKRLIGSAQTYTEMSNMVDAMLSVDMDPVTFEIAMNEMIKRAVIQKAVAAEFLKEARDKQTFIDDDGMINERGQQELDKRIQQMYKDKNLPVGPEFTIKEIERRAAESGHSYNVQKSLEGL